MFDSLIRWIRGTTNKKPKECTHKHTFDVLFTVESTRQYLITLCKDCESIVDYTNLNDDIIDQTEISDTISKLDKIHTSDATAVIKTGDDKFVVYDIKSGRPLQSIKFQRGNNNINGVTNEDLLSAVLLRMEAFQDTDLRCRETSDAMHHIKYALRSIEKRNKDRDSRNVRGTQKP